MNRLKINEGSFTYWFYGKSILSLINLIFLKQEETCNDIDAAKSTLINSLVDFVHQKSYFKMFNRDICNLCTLYARLLDIFIITN